jgi:hypothetical protein
MRTHAHSAPTHPTQHHTPGEAARRGDSAPSVDAAGDDVAVVDADVVDDAVLLDAVGTGVLVVATAALASLLCAVLLGCRLKLLRPSVPCSADAVDDVSVDVVTVLAVVLAVLVVLDTLTPLPALLDDALRSLALPLSRLSERAPMLAVSCVTHHSCTSVTSDRSRVL